MTFSREHRSVLQAAEVPKPLRDFDRGRGFTRAADACPQRVRHNESQIHDTDGPERARRIQVFGRARYRVV